MPSQDPLDFAWLWYECLLRQHDAQTPVERWRVLCAVIYGNYGIIERVHNGIELPTSWRYAIPPEAFDPFDFEHMQILHHWSNKIFFYGSRPESGFSLDRDLMDLQWSWLIDFMLYEDLSELQWTHITEFEHFLFTRCRHAVDRPDDKSMLAFSINPSYYCNTFRSVERRGS